MIVVPSPGGLVDHEPALECFHAVGEPSQAGSAVWIRASDAVVGDDHLERRR